MNEYEIYNLESGYLITIDDEVTHYDFYDVPKQIIDIIKQFEQENKQLKKQLELEIKVRDEIHNYLHNKIDKAIEYIEENRDYQDILFGRSNYSKGEMFTEDILREENIEKLIEILKDGGVDAKDKR